MYHPLLCNTSNILSFYFSHPATPANPIFHVTASNYDYFTPKIVVPMIMIAPSIKTINKNKRITLLYGKLMY